MVTVIELVEISIGAQTWSRLLSLSKYRAVVVDRSRDMVIERSRDEPCFFRNFITGGELLYPNLKLGI